MKPILKFYNNMEPADGRIFYSFNDIVSEWSDYRLQVRKNYINWLFPSENDTKTRLTSEVIYKFKTNRNLRANIAKAVIRMMLFFGYTVDMKTMMPIQVGDLKREENHVIIGFYNPDNYAYITRILHFLEVVKMPELSAIFFHMICMAMHANPDLKQLINNKNVISTWVKTQSYLEKERYKAEESLAGAALEDWEKTYEEPSETVAKIKDAWDE